VELTVQHQPFHIGLESLLWQKDLRTPAVVLGAQAGFSTNRV
jgi:gentisate 1,2-dioxygenase